MTPKPTLVEKMAQEIWETWRTSGQAGEVYQSLEWGELVRLAVNHGGAAQRLVDLACAEAHAALAVVMAEMREPSEGMLTAHDLAHAKAETVFADPADVWRAMLSVFEEDNK